MYIYTHIYVYSLHSLYITMTTENANELNDLDNHVTNVKIN